MVSVGVLGWQVNKQIEKQIIGLQLYYKTWLLTVACRLAIFLPIFQEIAASMHFECTIKNLVNRCLTRKWKLILVSHRSHCLSILGMRCTNIHTSQRTPPPTWSVIAGDLSNLAVIEQRKLELSNSDPLHKKKFGNWLRGCLLKTWSLSKVPWGSKISLVSWLKFVCLKKVWVGLGWITLHSY